MPEKARLLHCWVIQPCSIMASQSNLGGFEMKKLKLPLFSLLTLSLVSVVVQANMGLGKTALVFERHLMGCGDSEGDARYNLENDRDILSGEMTEECEAAGGGNGHLKVDDDIICTINIIEGTIPATTEICCTQRVS